MPGRPRIWAREVSVCWSGGAQRRKGEAAEPYMNHLTEVAELVARSIDGADPDIIVAAVLHDTVEDTSATIDAGRRLRR